MNKNVIKDVAEKQMPPELPNDTRKKEVKKIPFITIEEVINSIKDNCDKTEMKKYGIGRNYVVILPEAWEELKVMIGWGKETPTNRFEQLYQGMGYYFKDMNGKTILVVTHFLYIYAANRSPVSACISNGEHDSIMNRLEYEREIYRGNELRYNRTPKGKLYNPFVKKYGCSEVNLYGHTHPGIGVFFSNDDRTSGYATRSLPAATFVADPIREELKAMVGVEQEEAQIIVCEYTNSAFADKYRNIRYEEPMVKKTMEKIVSDNRKTKDELILELGKTCNELLNPVYGSKGAYITNTTISGKEHIKLDIKISPKVATKRRNMPSFASVREETVRSYDEHV